MKKSNSKKQLINLVTAALFAALIAVMTAYVSFKTGINDGYLHFGDSMIYIAACVLPLPYAMAAAAIGGALADILGGAAIWAPSTAVIKALNVLPFALVYILHKTKTPNKILNKTTAFMPIVSGVITALGYFLAEGLLFSFASALTSVPFSCVQAVGSAVVYYVLAAALDKINFKQRIMK